jgi:CarD family transcriptional regulator
MRATSGTAAEQTPAKAAAPTGGIRFEVGDRVVHPHHGIGTITALAERQFGQDTPRSYYEISVEGGTLWVPADEPGLGLRRLVGRGQLDQCGRILESAPSSMDVSSRGLRGQFSRRLRDGTIAAQCEVVRDLTALGWRRPLVGPMAEFRRMALRVLCEEWAIVAGISMAEANDAVAAHLGIGRRMHHG